VKYHSDHANKFANQMLSIKPSLNQLERALEL